MAFPLLLPASTEAQADGILRLAVEKLEQRDPEACALFGLLARDYDIREAWLGLAVAHHVQSRPVPAGDALTHALSRHANATVPRVADAIAESLGASGWCALDGAGILKVFLLGELQHQANLTACLDGRRLRLRPQPNERLVTAILPADWRKARELEVHARKGQLLGSPIQISRIEHVEGFVDTTNGDLHGWAWHPNDPDRDPTLSIVPTDGSVGISITADDPNVRVASPSPFGRPRGFYVPAHKLCVFAGPLQVLGPDGRNLAGSPIDVGAERRSAKAATRLIAARFPASGKPPDDLLELSLPAVPAHIVGGPVRGGSKRRPVDVVIPVHNQSDLALGCIETVLAHLPRWGRVVVVDDASTDPLLQTSLASLAAAHRITLITREINRGFPSTANIGMSYDQQRDIVLLNSDTLPPPAWLKRLREIAYSAKDIGTVTPISNDATILSYPSVDRENQIPNLSETIGLDTIAWKVNGRTTVEVPTAVGFCTYIKRDCLVDTGLFREDVFAQGYGEENDFCIRARHLGWRHVAAPGIFVGHVGGQSFGSAKKYLIERNLRQLNKLHPGYDRLVQDFVHQDPMAEPRRRIDLARWEGFRPTTPAVVLVTHGRGGGVQRYVVERARAIRAEGLRPIVLWPVASHAGDGFGCVLGNGTEGGTPNLRFAIPSEMEQLVRVLEADNPLRAEVHHLVGHDHRLLDLFERLRIPYNLTVHDYSWLCPRINLVGASRRYCGEPEVDECESCISAVGSTNEEDITPSDLRERSAKEMAGASTVVVPSPDVSSRIRRYFPSVRPTVVGWEDDSILPPITRSQLMPDGIYRICIIGAIGVEKGYDLLLACARDALNRDLKLRFHVVGYSCNDDALLETGRVSLTGKYEGQEAIQLIKQQGAQLAWLPSVWPETWCYTLSEAWHAGLQVLAFDIGTPADRIRRTGRGWTVPLGVSPRLLNQQLLKLAQIECIQTTRRPRTKERSQSRIM